MTDDRLGMRVKAKPSLYPFGHYPQCRKKVRFTSLYIHDCATFISHNTD